MAKESSETGKDVGKPVENRDEPEFRYSLELVATIAAHFADGKTDDREAVDRAIRLLDAASTKIQNANVWLRARRNAERISEETPKHLEFAKGIRWITGKRTETDRMMAFRTYLRLNLRLSRESRNADITNEKVTELLEPLADGVAQAAEDDQIEQIIIRFRRDGFGQVPLVTIKEQWESYQAGILRPYQAVKKGKKGGRPRGSRKSRKKSLELGKKGKK